MNIGTVAEKSGVPPKTIRYYESIGLIPSADRRANGYRTYSEIDMYTLNFIKRARSLGFSVDEVRDLLDLWRDKRRSSAKVKALTSEHLKALDRKIAELKSMRITLRSEEPTSELQSIMRISSSVFCLKQSSK